MQSASMEQPPLFRVHSLLSERDQHVGMLAVFIIIDTGKNHIVLDLERIIIRISISMLWTPAIHEYLKAQRYSYMTLK